MTPPMEIQKEASSHFSPLLRHSPHCCSHSQGRRAGRSGPDPLASQTLHEWDRGTHSCSLPGTPEWGSVDGGCLRDAQPHGHPRARTLAGPAALWPQHPASSVLAASLSIRKALAEIHITHVSLEALKHWIVGPLPPAPCPHLPAQVTEIY